ncbi:MAG TPA: peptide deformylase [Actinomycetota bacterium]|nr:peptide deformylase [Actinomycetota bacterium]
MAVLPIRQFGDPVLRERAREIEQVTDLHRRLAKDMIETMRAAPGVGLAANQVGVLERIFVWQFDDTHGILINPVISERAAETLTDDEGCLSLPGITYPVARSAAVTIDGLDENGRSVRLEAEDHLARIFQHEVDHLDGVLFTDRLSDELRKDALRVLRDRALGLPTSFQMPDEDAL